MTNNFIGGTIGMYLFAFAAILGIIVCAGVIGNASYNNLYTYISFVTLILLLILIFKYRIYKYTQKICTIYKSNVCENYFIPTKLTICKEGVHVTTNILDVYFEWCSLSKLYLIDNFLMILTYTDDIVFIPVHTIETDDKILLLNKIQQSSNLTVIEEYPKEFRYA